MIDKRMLTDTLTVTLKGAQDGFGGIAYRTPFLLAPVRFDRSVAVTGTENNITRSKTGVIYIYSKFVDKTVDDNWLGAKVSDGQHEYKVTGYQANYLPNGRLLGYEVEVV